MATRSSSRTKVSAAPVAPTTRSTRAKASAAKATTPPSLPVPPPPKKAATRKPLVNRANTDDVPSQPPSKSTTRKAMKVNADSVEADREPIMVRCFLSVSSHILTFVSRRIYELDLTQMMMAMKLRRLILLSSRTLQFAWLTPKNIRILLPDFGHPL